MGNNGLNGKCDYLLVPVELCIYSIKNRKVNQVRLYLYLKSSSNGFITINPDQIISIANKLGNCSKTVRNHLRWLQQNKWLILDQEVGSTKIIGFESLARKLNFTIATGAIFYKDEIEYYSGFACAAIIEYLITKKKRRWILAGCKKGRPSLQNHLRYPSLPHEYFAKVISKSKRTAANYRQLSKKNKYITTKEKLEDLRITIPMAENDIFKKYYSEKPHLLRRKNNRIYKQLPDHIETTIFLRTKGNLRKVCRENYRRKKTTPLKGVQ